MPAPLPAQRRVLVFDTETTGLKPAIVCQLGFALHTTSGQCQRESGPLLQLPPGGYITRGAQKVHSISNHDCRARGVAAVPCLLKFLDLAREVASEGGLVVAHNAAFDVRALDETLHAWRRPERMVRAPTSRTLARSDLSRTLAL